MKRLFVLVALVGIFSLPAFGQLSLGPKVGINYSTLIIDDRQINPEYELGFVFGAFARIELGKFTLQPELLYSTTRSEVEALDSAGVRQGIGDVKTSNLDIPIMLGYNLIDGDQFKLRLVAGPVASLTLDQDAGPLDIPESSFENFRFGYQAGIGLDIWKVTVDVRYQGSFSNTIDFAGTSFPPNTDNPQTGLIQFTAGFKIL